MPETAQQPQPQPQPHSKTFWGQEESARVRYRRSRRNTRLHASSSSSEPNGFGAATNGDTTGATTTTTTTRTTPPNPFWPSAKPRTTNTKPRPIATPEDEPGETVSAEFCNANGNVNANANGNANGNGNAYAYAADGDEEYNDDDDEYHDCDYYDTVFDSIVKIYATHSFEPDTTMPWQKQQSYTSTSSGFVISERRILTNAHSVEYAGQVLVRRRGSSQKYRATIEIVANECDMAVLTIQDTIQDESFWTTRTDFGDDDDDDDDDYDYDDYDDNEYDNNDNHNEYEDNDNDNDNDANPDSEIGNDDDGNDDGDDDGGGGEEEERVPDAIRPLEFGALPELQDEVEVLGYPAGGDSLSVTKGVVSRIEATEYAQCSGSHLLAIQIDAAINGGNSGGPVVDAATGKVVGVAFQALEHAENIGYVVPVTVVLHFLEDIRRHGAYTGVTCLGVRFSRLENESMRRYLKLPPKKESWRRRRRGGSNNNNNSNSNSNSKSATGGNPSNTQGGGIMVRSCFPTCPSKTVLKENDVILSIDGIPVASDGNVPFRRNGRERVSFASYVQTKFGDDTVELDLWRDGGPHRVTVPLAISRNLVPSHWNNQAPPYVIAGGLVFTALSVPYLEDCGAWGEYVSDSLNYLSNKIYEPLERPDDQVVVLINVLAHPRNTGYDGLTNLHLRSLNGKDVRSLKHLRELISTEQEEQRRQQEQQQQQQQQEKEQKQEQRQRQKQQSEHYLRFEFGSKSSDGGGILVVLETDSIEDINREVCEEHSIQKSFYFPPDAPVSRGVSVSESSS
eukprot:CAMPEP_0172411840 /NCGR_PEP_ID=MMETSP1061-20121228/77598_1 /TAXON_ID=37318 /ORGANISM="Pseudo-nitzschia pungens, Strain cf. pungens" /LENGTH=791 /DNA_ID=CAMNT_0013148055 /DNA_START=209 /DNA_END=2584 /DNA_ORIENTATION=+